MENKMLESKDAVKINVSTTENIWCDKLNLRSFITKLADNFFFLLSIFDNLTQLFGRLAYFFKSKTKTTPAAFIMLSVWKCSVM